MSDGLRDGGATRLLYLKRAVFEVLSDVGREILVLLGVLLHGDLALQLGHELFVDYHPVSQAGTHGAAINSPPLASCLRAADKWNDAASLGAAGAHAGGHATARRSSDDCGRVAVEDRRAADRGAARARFRRASMACGVDGADGGGWTGVRPMGKITLHAPKRADMTSSAGPPHPHLCGPLPAASCTIRRHDSLHHGKRNHGEEAGMRPRPRDMEKMLAD